MPKQTDSQSNSSESSPVHNQNTATTETHPASDGRVATFIRKVYNILEEQLFPDIVDWSQDGLAIVIKKPTEFSQKVLPKYFKHNHISSFIRQLNMYSFQKKRSRHAGHIYAHDLFQRGGKHLLCQIKRKVKDFANTSTGSGQDMPPIANSTGNGNNNNVSSVVNPAGPDVNTLISENQLLKNLQEQAMSKMKALEQRINELTTMNQNLHAQLQGKVAMENTNMKQEQQKVQQVQHIYNLNKAMLVGVKNPFVMNANGNVKQEDEIQSMSPVKGLSLTINKPAGQNQPERFMIGGNNTFTIGPNFINTNPNVIKPMMMNEENVSPSTRPSPPNSDNMPINPELGQWGHQLMQQQQSLQNLQNAQQNFQNLQNLQHRLSISQTHGIFSNLSESKEPMNIPVYGNNNIGKRELELEDVKQIEEPLRKFMQKSWNDQAATLNLSDIRKFHSNLFSSIGDKEFDPKHDTEVDLLCFE